MCVGGGGGGAGKMLSREERVTVACGIFNLFVIEFVFSCPSGV